MKIKDNIANEFDEFSKNYTNDMIGCVPYYLNLMSYFTKKLPENFDPEHILDLGCGNGNVSKRLMSYFPNAQYTLLDASEEMLNLCSQQFKNYKVKYVNSYFQDFSFKDNTYDLIAAGFSLHHCDSEEKRDLFQKIYQSLKRGGIFTCSDLMISKNHPEHSKVNKDWKEFVNNNFPNGEKWKWLMEHYSEFDKPDNHEEQLSWLKNIGFNNVKITVHENYWAHFKAVKS